MHPYTIFYFILALASATSALPIPRIVEPDKLHPRTSTAVKVLTGLGIGAAAVGLVGGAVALAPELAAGATVVEGGVLAAEAVTAGATALETAEAGTAAVGAVTEAGSTVATGAAAEGGLGGFLGNVMNGVETAGESLWTKAKSAFSGIKSLFESGSESKVNPLDFAGNGSSKNGKTAAQAAKAQGDISRPPNGNGPAGIPAGGVPANPEPVGSVSQPPTGGAGKTHKHDTKAGTADTAAKAAQAAGA